MSLVDWLKGLTDRPEEGVDDGAKAQRPAGARPQRKGGEAYAKEWVKVLEEAGPGHDPFNTYTWELGAEAPAGAPAPQGESKPRPNASAEPGDTYTWELQEGPADDPWGLKKEEAPEKPTKKSEGVNPYDTGVFDATWTGRFDQR